MSEDLTLSREKTYDFDNAVGWRRYRALQPCKGIWHDISRRLPYYWSDIRDGFNYRTLASTVRIYFVNLLPALAFLLDMNRQTEGFYGVNEALFASALAAFIFSLFSAQPITIVGITGLISLFNYTIYDIVKQYDVSIYPQVMVWTGIWAAIFHWLFAICNFCDYMRYVTDFSSQSFAMYVGIIYIIKGVEELVALFEFGFVNGYLSCIIGILFFGTVHFLERIGDSRFLKGWMRDMLSDYAYPIATIFWTGFSHIPGRLKDSNLIDLPITKAFFPTVDRDWVIPFWNLSVKWVFVAMPLGFLTMLLFYYDHNISSITAQAKQFPLKKPGGFHWDFFLLGVCTIVTAVIGLPFPNGLVPQAPVHTDSLTVYTARARRFDSTDLDNGEQLELREREVIPEKVVEQRISHFLMCLALFGTMSGPLLVVLGTMPRALFTGVFFVVGWGSISGNEITKKILYLISEKQYIRPDSPLCPVPRRKICLFLAFQVVGVLSCVAISQTIAAIGFPILIIALIPIRWKLFPHWFSAEELKGLDDLTAKHEVVLASIGGAPELPEEAMLEGRKKVRRMSFKQKEKEKPVNENASGSSSATSKNEDEGRREGIYRYKSPTYGDDYAV